MMKNLNDLNSIQKNIMMQLASGKRISSIATDLKKTEIFIDNQVEYLRHNFNCLDLNQLIDVAENFQLAHAYRLEELRLTPLFVYQSEEKRELQSVQSESNVDEWNRLSDLQKIILKYYSDRQSLVYVRQKLMNDGNPLSVGEVSKLILQAIEILSCTKSHLVELAKRNA